MCPPTQRGNIFPLYNDRRKRRKLEGGTATKTIKERARGGKGWGSKMDLFVVVVSASTRERESRVGVGPLLSAKRGTNSGELTSEFVPKEHSKERKYY